MTKKYKVTYFPIFYRDLDKITDYITYKLKNLIAANNFVDKLENEINKRAFNPEIYEPYKSTKFRKNKYFRIYIDNYTIFYTVNGNVMELRRILYSKRNFKNIIK